MSLRAKLGFQDIGMLAAFSFHTVVGIVCLVVLATVDFRLVHIGMIGILSLLTAYGLFRRRHWTLWGAVVLFLVATVFSPYMLYFTFQMDLLLDLSLVLYLALTWLFSIYTLLRRKSLEN